MSRAALLVTAVALAALPAAANAKLPVYLSGTSVGEGVPLKAYASVTPTVHLFGDAITARLAIVADTKYVDPRRLRVATGFRPYTVVRPPVLQKIALGRFTQVTWTWTLRCLTAACVPRQPPSDRYHVFRFQTIHISYLSLRGRPAYAIDATFPKVEVLSQVSPGIAAFLQRTSRLNWRFSLSPVSAPTYRMSPRSLSTVALALAGALFLAAAVAMWRWYRTLRPAPTFEARAATGTPLERALNVLAWAHARGDETLERKALERVAGELHAGVTAPEVDELSRTARELAWSPRTPEDEDVETIARRARTTRRRPEPEESQE